MKAVKIDVKRLEKGMYIRLPGSWSSHPFLFNSFRLKQQSQIELIGQLGFKDVLYIPSRSAGKPLLESNDVDINSGDSEACKASMAKVEKTLWAQKQKRIEQLKKYRRGLQKCEKDFEHSVDQVRSVLGKISNRPLNAIQKADDLVEGIVEKLLAHDDMVLHLMNETKDGDNLYYHALNVSVLSMLLAKAKKLSREEIKQVGMGALFHDIGKVKIPSQILNKTDRTRAEQNFYNLHPKYGIELLSHVETFPEGARRIVLEHHEYLDGSGTPSGLRSGEIHQLSSLVALVNEYDMLCHPRDVKRARTPYNALSFLFKHRKKQFYKKDIELIVSQLGVYPPGSVVKLDNGQFGLVTSVNPAKLLSPNVLIYDPSVPRTEAPIISLEDAQTRIVGSINPRRLPREVYEYLNPRARISFFFESKD
jgi:putative nucleotidyltransferase with HDIG domain